MPGGSKTGSTLNPNLTDGDTEESSIAEGSSTGERYPPIIFYKYGGLYYKNIQEGGDDEIFNSSYCVLNNPSVDYVGKVYNYSVVPVGTALRKLRGILTAGLVFNDKSVTPYSNTQVLNERFYLKVDNDKLYYSTSRSNNWYPRDKVGTKLPNFFAFLYPPQFLPSSYFYELFFIDFDGQHHEIYSIITGKNVKELTLNELAATLTKIYNPNEKDIFYQKSVEELKQKLMETLQPRLQFLKSKQGGNKIRKRRQKKSRKRPKKSNKKTSRRLCP